MNFAEFLNKRIINKNNERGVIISIDENYVTIKFENVEKAYNTKIVFENKFISFVDKNLEDLLNEQSNIYKNQSLLEEEKIQKEKKNYIKKYKAVEKLYYYYQYKQRILKSYFGRDYIYPPFLKLKKKFKDIVDRIEEDHSQDYIFYQ